MTMRRILILTGLVLCALALLAPAMALAAQPRQITLRAASTAQTYRIPGSAPDFRLVSISEDGHRFQYLSTQRNDALMYGGGVTVEIAQRQQTYYVTTVAVGKPAKVTIRYRLGPVPKN